MNVHANIGQFREELMPPGAEVTFILLAVSFFCVFTGGMIITISAAMLLMGV